MEERIHYLQDLGDFLSKTRTSLKVVAERLGWSVKKNEVGLGLGNCDPMVTCPLNSGHRVPEKRLQEHLKACAWKSEGYLPNSIPLPEPCDNLGANTIVIDSELAEKICCEAAAQDPAMIRGTLKVGYRPVPQTSDRLFTTYTTDERRAIYDYVVSKVGGAQPLKLEDLQLPFDTDKKHGQEKSELELLAEERDAKRRRMSYRGKKVSTNRKSYTEVMREVIENQMQMYQLLLKKDFKDEIEHESTSRPAKSEHSDDDDKEKDDDEKYEQRSEKDYNSRWKRNDGDERSYRRHSSDEHRHGHSGREKYDDRQKYRESYDRYERKKYKYSEQGHRESRRHRSRSRDRRDSRGRDERGYRERESRDRYSRDGAERVRERENRYRRDDTPVKAEKNSEHGSQCESRERTLPVFVQQTKIKQEKINDDECPSLSKFDPKILEHMQLLLEAHKRADRERDKYKRCTKSVSNEPSDSDGSTSQQFGESSHKYSKHKSKSHRERKKRKKSDHKHKKRHKHRKHSSSSASSQYSDYSS